MADGPRTNTRTLDTALADVIKRLGGLEPLPEVNKLIARAERFREIMAGWEKSPAVPGQEHQVIADAMELLKTAIALGGDVVIKRVEVTAEPKPATPEVVKAPAKKEIGRIKVKAGSDQATVSVAETERARTRLHEGVTLLRPPRARWQAVGWRPGVTFMMLHDDPETGPCRALVRLEPGAALPEYEHLEAEDLYVVSGTIQVGDVRLSAGEILHSEAGSINRPMCCVGECTLLLIGSDRHTMLSL